MMKTNGAFKNGFFRMESEPEASDNLIVIRRREIELSVRRLLQEEFFRLQAFGEASGEHTSHFQTVNDFDFSDGLSDKTPFPAKGS